jgi:hypothetical protein
MTGDRPDEQNTIEDQSRRTVQSDEPELVTKPRSARVAAYNGKQVGVCIFLTVSELRELGINLSQIDTEIVEYAIDEKTSKLAIRPRNR